MSNEDRLAALKQSISETKKLIDPAQDFCEAASMPVSMRRSIFNLLTGMEADIEAGIAPHNFEGTVNFFAHSQTACVKLYDLYRLSTAEQKLSVNFRMEAMGYALRLLPVAVMPHQYALALKTLKWDYAGKADATASSPSVAPVI